MKQRCAEALSVKSKNLQTTLLVECKKIHIQRAMALKFGNKYLFFSKRHHKYISIDYFEIGPHKKAQERAR